MICLLSSVFFVTAKLRKNEGKIKKKHYVIICVRSRILQ